jgi:hypothetical protein
VLPLTADQVRRALDDSDLYTLGEVFDFEEEAIDAALSELEVKPGRNSGNASVLELHCNAGGRPVCVWAYEPEKVQEQVREALEGIPSKSKDPGAERVRQHLSQTRSVIAVELGLAQIDTVAEVLATALGYWFAEQGDGLIDFYGNEWQTPDDRTTVWAPVDGASGE